MLLYNNIYIRSDHTMVPTPRLLVRNRALPTYSHIDDIFNPHEVRLFCAIGERVQTVTQIYRQRRVGLLCVSLTRSWS